MPLAIQKGYFAPQPQFDNTSLVSFGLLTDVEMVSKDTCLCSFADMSEAGTPLCACD